MKTSKNDERENEVGDGGKRSNVQTTMTREEKTMIIREFESMRLTYQDSMNGELCWIEYDVWKDDEKVLKLKAMKNRGTRPSSPAQQETTMPYIRLGNLHISELVR